MRATVLSCIVVLILACGQDQPTSAGEPESTPRAAPAVEPTPPAPTPAPAPAANPATAAAPCRINRIARERNNAKAGEDGPMSVLRRDTVTQAAQSLEGYDDLSDLAPPALTRAQAAQSAGSFQPDGAWVPTWSGHAYTSITYTFGSDGRARTATLSGASPGASAELVHEFEYDCGGAGAASPARP